MSFNARARLQNNEIFSNRFNGLRCSEGGRAVLAHNVIRDHSRRVGEGRLSPWVLWCILKVSWSLALVARAQRPLHRLTRDLHVGVKGNGKWWPLSSWAIHIQNVSLEQCLALLGPTFPSIARVF